MEYTFISYSTKNQLAADSVRKILNDSGYHTWMAPWDIPPGQKYASAINQAIRNCSCFILLLSNDAQNSVWVAKELERAVNYRKTIIPVQLEDVILNDEFELYISSDHAVPLYKIDPDSEPMHRIISSVSVCLGVSVDKEESSEEYRRIDRGSNYYYGKFLAEDITGVGEYFYADGSHYKGDFVNGRFHGEGELAFASGARYIGEFTGGVRNGKGRYFFASGARYEGDFTDGKRTGQGKYFFVNGDRHEGEFLCGKFHGKGKYFFASGDRYEGEFVNHRFQGKGKYVFENGDVYEGEYLEDIRTGYGSLLSADGRRFTGRFERGKRESGTMYSPDGKILFSK